MDLVGQRLEPRPLALQRPPPGLDVVLQGPDPGHRRLLVLPQRGELFPEALLLSQQPEEPVAGLVQLYLPGLGLERPVLLRLPSLAAQRVEPLLQLPHQVCHPQEVGLGGLHLPLGGRAGGLVLGDARRLLDEGPPVLRLGGDDEPDPALLDDRVGASPHSGAKEELHDVQEPAVGAVDEVFRLPGTEEPPGDGDRRQPGVLRSELVASTDLEGERHLGHRHRRLGLAPVEDDVFHPPAAEVLRACSPITQRMASTTFDLPQPSDRPPR